MSFPKKFLHFKKYFPHFIVLYAIFIIILLSVFLLTETPFIEIGNNYEISIQPIFIFIAALLIPIIFTFLLIEYNPKLKEISPKFAKYSPYLLISYIGYLLLLLINYLQIKGYIIPETRINAGGLYTNPILIYGTLAIIPLIFFSALLYYERIFAFFKSLERKTQLTTFFYLILQLILNLFFFSVLLVFLPNKIDLKLFYGALDTSIISSTDLTLLIIIGFLFLIINIILNIFIGWIWIKKETNPPSIQYWILSYFGFGILIVILKLIIIIDSPEILNEAFFPWMGLVIMPALDFFLALISVGIVFISIIGQLLFPNPVGDAITFFYFMSAALLLLSITVILPLIPIILFYIGVGLRNLWAHRTKKSNNLINEEIFT